MIINPTIVKNCCPLRDFAQAIMPLSCPICFLSLILSSLGSSLPEGLRPPGGKISLFLVLLDLNALCFLGRCPCFVPFLHNVIKALISIGSMLDDSLDLVITACIDVQLRLRI